MFDTGVCIVFLVHEFTTFYIAVRNQERITRVMEIDLESDEIDVKLVALEQRKVIEQLKKANAYYKVIAKHYRELYLWPERRKNA